MKHANFRLIAIYLFPCAISIGSALRKTQRMGQKKEGIYCGKGMKAESRILDPLQMTLGPTAS
jgi:hypothetical protein